MLPCYLVTSVTQLAELGSTPQVDLVDGPVTTSECNNFVQPRSATDSIDCCVDERYSRCYSVC